MGGNKRDQERSKKLEARKARNRASAAASRKRKDDRIEQLEAQVQVLLGENAQLKLHAQMKQAMDESSSAASSSMSMTPNSSFPSTGYGSYPLESCTNNQLPAVSALYNG